MKTIIKSKDDPINYDEILELGGEIHNFIMSGKKVKVNNYIIFDLDLQSKLVGAENINIIYLSYFDGKNWLTLQNEDEIWFQE